MTSEGINRELRQMPFLPFRIVMTDGKAYDIRHPDHLWVGFLEAYVLTRAISLIETWDRPDTLDVSHIIRMEPLPFVLPPTSPESNGPQQTA